MLKNNKAPTAFIITMKIRISIAIAICSLLLSSNVQSQSRELGVMVGMMGYKGDLNPVMFSDKFLHPGLGVIYRASYNNHWSFRGAFNYGRISGDLPIIFLQSFLPNLSIFCRFFYPFYQKFLTFLD